MLNYRLLQQLAPLNFRDERKTETLDDYLDRVSPLVPSIPSNVLAQWIYRHWRGFESNWSFIDLASHQFECEHWPTAQIIEQIDSRHMEVIDRWGEMLRSNRYVRRSWLGDDMLYREPGPSLSSSSPPPRAPATRTVTPCPIPTACWRGTTDSATCAAWPPIALPCRRSTHSGFVDPFATLKRFSGQTLPLK